MNLDVALLASVHLTVLAGQLLLVRYALGRRRLYGFFFAAVALYQAVSLFTLPGALREFGAVALLQAETIAAAGTLLLAAFVLAGERLASRALDHRGPNPMEAVVTHPGAYLAVIATCIVVVAVLTFRDGFGVLGRTWQQARLESTYLDGLATLLLFLLFPSAWIAVRAGRRALAAVLLVASLALFVVYGTRAALLTLPMVVLLDFLLRRAGRDEPVRVRTIAIIAAAALALHVVGRLVRGFGMAGLVAILSGEGAGNFDVADALAHMDWSGGEAAIFRYFLFVVAAGPFADIEPLTSVIRWLGLYVPGTLFVGAKPVDATYTIWWHAYSGGLFDAYDSFRELLVVVGAGGGGSVHATIWGEMWVNGGWLALPVFAFGLAAALMLIEAVYARIPAVPFLLAAPATLIGLVMVARGNSVIGLGYTAYVLPLALAGYGATRVVGSLFVALRERMRPCG